MNTEETKTTNTNEPLAEELAQNQVAQDTTETSAKEVSTEQETNSENAEATQEADVAKLQAEIAEYKDKYLRLYADFENFRRRNIKEKADLVKYAGEESIKSMLTVLDDFERALRSIETTTEVAPIKEGIQLVFNKFQRILEQNGLKVIDTKQGDTFDLEKHESITQIPAPTEELKGKVIDVVEKGYLLQDKIIRFAKVVVGS